jgi:hypothetical protein
MECDEYLSDGINIPKEKRRWKETCGRRSLIVKKGGF